MALQNAAFTQVTAALLNYATGKPQYIGWGTGTGVAVSGTALATAAAEARTTGTLTAVTGTTPNDTFQAVGTIVCAGAGKTISEAGLFDATTAGNMFQYGSFTGIPLLVGDSIAFTIQAKFT